ncbi:MAG: hypothetical protein A2X64_02510 [Ignavibacteria bacterium GWF2_33_9]|nr:MAG: hypothetical protein A2X64_02510 [Ignavibacteria bacterium GWF2_33_9]
MYRTIIIVVALIVSSWTLLAQNSIDEFYRLVTNKDFEAAQEMIQQVSTEKPKDLKLLTTCGDVYFELEKYQDALKYYAKAYDIEDENQEINRKYALTLASVNDFNKALKIINQTIKDNKKEVQNYLTASEIYIKADSLTEAEIEIDRAMALDPNNPDIYVTSGNFYYARRVYELARDNYLKAVELDSTIVEAHFKLATSYYWLATRELDRDLANELFTRSLKEWNTVSKLDSMNAKAYFEQGKIWFFSDRFADAAPPLSRYIKLRPNGSLGRWYFAQSLFNLGKWEEAIPQLIQCANEIDSIRTTATQKLADCYLAVKNYPLAMDTYRKLEVSTDFTAEDHRKFGQAAFFAADTVEAINQFKKAIDMDKDNSCGLMYSIGNLLSYRKDYEASTNMLKLRLETAACQDSLNSKVLYVIGTNYLFSSQPDSAAYYFQQSIALDSINVFAIVYLGDALIQLSNVKEGVDQYKRVLTLYASYPSINQNAVIQAYAKIANYHLDKKDYNELNRVAKKWTEAFPDNSFAFLYLAVSYQGMGDKDNSCKYYKRVLQLDPGNATAKSNMKLMDCSN